MRSSAQPPSSPAQSARARARSARCGSNQIVCENALPGKPREPSGTSGQRRRQHPGVRHSIQRRPRADRSVQGEDRRIGLPHRHLSARVVRRARRAEGGDGHTQRRRCPSSSRPACRRRPPAWSTAATGRYLLRGTFPRPPSQGSTSARLVRPDTGGGEPHRLRRSRRRAPLRPPLPDVGHDLAGVQPLRRQQPLLRRDWGGHTRSATTGRSTTRGHTNDSFFFSGEYPMIRWLERNGYDVSYFVGSRHRRSRRRAPRAQDIPLGRARRVLVGRAARQRRSGQGRRRQPCVLQRQRGLLEDALGAEHRRQRDAVHDPRLVQGNSGEREDRPEPASGQARGATHASAHPPTAAGRRTR